MSPESCWTVRKGSIMPHRPISISCQSTKTHEAGRAVEKRTCSPCCCCCDSPPSSPWGKETPLIFPPARTIHHSVNLATHPLSPSSSSPPSSSSAFRVIAASPPLEIAAARFSFSRFLRLARFASSSSVLLHRRTTTLRSDVWMYSKGIRGSGWKVRWVIGFVEVFVELLARGRMELGKEGREEIRGLN